MNVCPTAPASSGVTHDVTHAWVAPENEAAAAAQQAVVASGSAEKARSLMDMFASFDLRFDVHAEEGSFKSTIEPQVALHMAISCMLVPIGAGIQFVGKYSMAMQNDNYPFEWATDDPRTQVLGLRLAVATFYALMAGLLLLHWWRGKLRCLNIELVAVVTASLLIPCILAMSGWHTAMRWGKSPEYVWGHDVRDEELNSMLTIITIVTTVCLFVPLRTCSIWVLHLSALITVTVMVAGHEAPFPESRPNNCFLSLIHLVFSFVGSYRNELALREKWRALVRVGVAETQVIRQECQLKEKDAQLEEHKRLLQEWCAPRGDAVSAVVQRPESETHRAVRTMTWNMAGVSSNVFEFWGLAPHNISEAVERCIVSGCDGQLLDSIMTEKRVQDLQRRLVCVGWPAVPDEVVASLRATSIVQYLGDKSVGKKRFVSLPDRFTAALGQGRPGVTTPYTGSIGCMDEWWEAWSSFIFEEGAYKKIGPHPKKYQSALTELEIHHSQSLQLLHLALYDGALVQMLGQVAPGWIGVKRQLLTTDRVALGIKILRDSYGAFDVILLQEVTVDAQRMLVKALPDFQLVAGGSRGQDSLVIVRRSRFTNVVDETVAFMSSYSSDVTISPGDACVVRACINGTEVILGSFHSDSDGHMTVPFVEAFMSHVESKTCLLGIDGNMASDPDKGKLSSADFRAAIAHHGMHSCLPEDVWTTFKARTFVQPQFQKAVLSKNLAAEADMGPKDHILARGRSFFAAVERDTTGRHQFIDAPLPTESFPSDHAIVAADVLL